MTNRNKKLITELWELRAKLENMLPELKEGEFCSAYFLKNQKFARTMYKINDVRAKLSKIILPAGKEETAIIWDKAHLYQHSKFLRQKYGATVAVCDAYIQALGSTEGGK